MKKLALLIVILYIFTPKPTHAASELEIWCLAEGETWDSVTSTCFVAGQATFPEPSSKITVLLGETIDIDVGGTIYNYDRIYNYGTIDNDGNIYTSPPGQLFNRGTIINNGNIYTRDSSTLENYDDGNTAKGHILNYGTIYIDSIDGVGFLENHDDGTIDNYGTIDNDGLIRIYDGTINNYGTIINNSNVINNGTINNYCWGIYNGYPPDGNPVVYVPCSILWLPLIKG